MVLRSVREVLEFDGATGPNIAWRDWRSLSSEARNKYVDVVNCAAELEQLKRHSLAHPEACFSEKLSTKHKALDEA